MSNNPFITIFENSTDFSFKVTGGEGYESNDLTPPINTVINTNYDPCLFNYILLNIYSGKSATGDYLGTASVSIKGSGDSRYLLDSNNLLVFEYDAIHSKYESSDPWKWRRAEIIKAPSILAGPPIITNNGWKSGMENSDDKPVQKANFFSQDYGMNEDGRWVVCDGAICQKTSQIGKNVGSRAYPVYISTGAPTWTIPTCEPKSGICSNIVAPGVAFEGCWQIQMKCGSTGGGNFCETFYLAERANLNPGPNNYQDGSGSAAGGNSREIDIMETKWQPDGPQANCPNNNKNGWNTDYSNKLMGKWDDIGGMPMKDFVIFGCLIRDNNLWIYGYKSDGSQWYSSDTIPMNNTSYNQENPFIPYIGTWANKGTLGGNFNTCYNNYIYLEADDAKISGKNPKENPESFGNSLI